MVLRNPEQCPPSTSPHLPDFLMAMGGCRPRVHSYAPARFITLHRGEISKAYLIRMVNGVTLKELGAMNIAPKVLIVRAILVSDDRLFYLSDFLGRSRTFWSGTCSYSYSEWSPCADC